MADITKCSGDNCPIKDKCYRFTAPDSTLLQSYFMEPPFYIKNAHVICEMFWKDTRKEDSDEGF